MIKLLKLRLDKKRIYGLDILRAIAILLVVVSHAENLLPKSFSSIHKLIDFDGVHFFFVLSGFLIGGILIKIIESNGSTFNKLLNFWIRRWFRTLPNYFFVLSIITSLSFIFIEKFELKSVSKYFYFSQNLYSSHPPFFPEAWSLSIEEWFYLIIPSIVFSFIGLLKFTPKKSIIITTIGIILIITLFRYIRHLNIKIEDISQWDLFFRKQVLMRLDSLMYGVIGAYCNYYFFQHWIRHKNYLLFLGLLILFSSKFLVYLDFFSVGGLYFNVFYLSTISIGTLFLLPFLSTLNNGVGLISNAVTYISLISYSLYLVHYTLIQFWFIKKLDIISLLPSDSLLTIILVYVLYWSLSIVISIIIYKYFELPVMKIRDKFNKKLYQYKT